jgi:hypothetical protein
MGEDKAALTGTDLERSGLPEDAYDLQKPATAPITSGDAAAESALTVTRTEDVGKDVQE